MHLPSLEKFLAVHFLAYPVMPAVLWIPKPPGHECGKRQGQAQAPQVLSYRATSGTSEDLHTNVNIQKRIWGMSDAKTHSAILTHARTLKYKS